MSVADITGAGAVPGSTELAAPRASESRVRLACGLAAVGTLVPFALSSFSGDSGAEITASILDGATALQVGAYAAALVSALLVLAAVRLAGRIGGTAGSVVLASGAAVALMFVAYYAAFAAGAVVADHILADPGPGVGESTAVLVNLTELVRYAPGLALVSAAVVARARLPRAVWGTAAALAVLTIVPVTSWVAALLIPLWLAISAATVSARP
jgi:hypothetical protein